MIFQRRIGNIYELPNPIESTFATVRLRTAKTRGCVPRHTILAMVYKLGQSAQVKWLRLRGFKLLAEVIRGVQFKNGERIEPQGEGEYCRADKSYSCSLPKIFRELVALYSAIDVFNNNSRPV